jgi:phosphoribosylformylglycinamidine synthase
VLVDELVADPSAPRRHDIVVVAGGFSYGDALGAGGCSPSTSPRPTEDGSARPAGLVAGGPVIGICNGFQVPTRRVAARRLGHNAQASTVAGSSSPPSARRAAWLDEAPDVIHCPIAHGEGRYVHLTSPACTPTIASR